MGKMVDVKGERLLILRKYGQGKVKLTVSANGMDPANCVMECQAQATSAAQQ